MIIVDHVSLIPQKTLSKEDRERIRELSEKLVHLSKDLDLTHIINGKKYTQKDFR